MFKKEKYTMEIYNNKKVFRNSCERKQEFYLSQIKTGY